MVPTILKEGIGFDNFKGPVSTHILWMRIICALQCLPGGRTYAGGQNHQGCVNRGGHRRAETRAPTSAEA